MCFKHLGQKLCETLDFLQPKVNFSGEMKNTSKHINMNYRKPSISTVSISTVELFVTMARLARGQISVSMVKIGAIGKNLCNHISSECKKCSCMSKFIAPMGNEDVSIS